MIKKTIISNLTDALVDGQHEYFTEEFLCYVSVTAQGDILVPRNSCCFQLFLSPETAAVSSCLCYHGVCVCVLGWGAWQYHEQRQQHL